MRENIFFVSSNEARRTQCFEGLNGASKANSFICLTVNELQQLNCEFNVSEAAGSKFQLPVDVGGGNVVGHALTHALDLINKAWSCSA